MSASARRLTLKPAVYAATVEEHLVLLDVAADAYHCLPAEGAASLEGDRRTVILEEARLAQELLAAGFAEAAEDPTPPRRTAPAPTECALRTSYASPSLRDLCDGGIALADLWANYRGRSLMQMLRTVRPGWPQRPDPQGPGVQRRPPGSGDLRSCVDRFQAWRPYAPVSGKCLLQSFLLLRHLQRTGHDAAWVFGVTTWPFRAHCWLQAGPLVLDDELDRVLGYTPILVV
jgi:hypothetical protein